MTSTKYRVLFWFFSIFLAFSLFVLSIVFVLASPTHNIGSQIGVNYEAPSVNLNFVNNTGSNVISDEYEIRYNEDITQFYIEGIVPSSATYQDGSIINDKGQEFYYFSNVPQDMEGNVIGNAGEGSAAASTQQSSENVTLSEGALTSEDSFVNIPENKNILAKRYYPSSSTDPIWYDLPEADIELYSTFLTPNVHNSDFANAPLLDTDPNVIISHDVTEIPYNAFCDLLTYMGSQGQTGVAKIESVVIPNSVESINSKFDMMSGTLGGAFAGCATLTNIIIPSSVEYIGGEAFVLCSGLETIEYGNGYYLSTENNEHAILVDTNLKASNVTIHADCISIQGGTFSKYYFMALGLIPPPDMGDGSNEEEILRDYINMNLQKITIPKNVKNIGFAAFAVCTGLENVVIEDNSDLTNIGMLSFVESNLKTINLEVTKLEELTGSFSGCSSLTSITIPSGVTSIEGAFSGCSSLTSITIPESVTSIGDSTFSSCSSLTSITIPESVTSIGADAFNRCNSLTAIVIPNSVISIGRDSFSYCSNLKSVSFGDNSHLTSIGTYAFSYCGSLEIVDFGENSQLTSIGNYAFYNCSSLETVDFGENSQLTSIGSSAFKDCSSLTSITIPDSVTSTGESAFWNCSSLTSIVIPNSVTSIGDSVFYNCSSLETVNFGENSQLASIGSNAFQNCSSLTSITIPDSVTSIGGSAFSDCSGLTSITIPDSVTSIGNYAFDGCIGLTSITFEDMTGLTISGYQVFIDCDNIKQLIIQSGETKGFNFSVLDGLTTVTLGNGVTSIGDQTFYRCSSLTSITIPASVTNIGSDAFYDCSNIQKLYIDDLTSYLNISYGNYYSSPLYSADQAVSLYVGGELITNLEIPDGVTTIPGYAFMNLNITSATIPSSVTSIGVHAFSSCSSLTSITIPESVTSMGNYAFSSCSSLETVNFGDNSQLTSIGKYVFYGCSSLETVNFGENSQITSIGYWAFYNCSSLTSITIPSSVTSIEGAAFYNCSSLESVNFGEDSMLTIISNNAFDSCSSLTSITIPESVTNIHGFAFSDCSNIQELRIDNLTSYLNISYGNDESSPSSGADQAVSLYVGGELITNLVIPDGVTTIPDYAFMNLNITSVTIPSSVTSIGRFAFSSCSSLTSITIPNTVTSIGNYAFENCSSLTTITIPEGVTDIGDSVFSGCSSLTTITIPEGVTDIGDSAFSGCSSLTTIIIPSSVTSIENYVFDGCSKITIYCEAESPPSGWWSSWNSSSRPVYWAGQWEMVDGEPRPIESGVEGVGLSEIGEDFGIGFDGLGFREEIYFNDKRERKVV